MNAGRNSTARSRRFRQRQKNGLIRLTIEMDEDKICEWLVSGGVLSPLETDQHDKVERALARAVVLLVSGGHQ